ARKPRLFDLCRSSSITIVRAIHPRSGVTVHPAGPSAGFPGPRPPEQTVRVAFARVWKAGAAKRGPMHSAVKCPACFLGDRLVRRKVPRPKGEWERQVVADARQSCDVPQA